MTRTLPEGRSYRYIVAHKDGPYAVESDNLPYGKDVSEAEGLAGAYQHDDLVAVWELNPAEGTMRNVSEDMALKMLANSDAMEEMELSDFIRSTLNESQIADHFADRASWDNHKREISSPEYTGRI